MVAEQHAIETFSLTKVFPDWWGRAKVVAVDDLNLKIRYNEIYGFLGPNGSGKTTTLKMLLNLLHPTRGYALVLGGSTADPAVSRRIGYLPEESYLYPYLSARETLDFYGRLFNLPARVRESRIEALLEMVGLMGMANRHVGTFSKGMARRIGLAQALINDPELLILDEPTSGMDPIGTRQIKDLLLHLARRGKTILLCSHLLADVEDVCDRIGILYGGRMQVEGAVDSLLQQSDRCQILSGPLSPQTLDRIRQIIAEEQTDCDISTPMERLEQYFIQIVTRAQAEARPTSGAVNTMKIGGFLAEEAAPPEPGVLDTLVGKSIEPAAGGDVELESVQAEPAPPAATEEPEDRGLLDDLTRRAATLPTTESEPPSPQEPGEEEMTERPTARPEDQPVETVRQDILEALTGGAGSQAADGTTEMARPDEPEEDERA